MHGPAGTPKRKPRVPERAGATQTVLPDALVRGASLCDAETRLLTSAVRPCSKHGHCHPSYPTLMDDTGWGKRQKVARVLASLHGEHITKLPGHGLKNNSYCVLSEEAGAAPAPALTG